MCTDESETLIVDLESEFDAILEEDDDVRDPELQEILALDEFSELLDFKKFAVVLQSDGVGNEDVDEDDSVFDINDVINQS